MHAIILEPSFALNVPQRAKPSPRLFTELRLDGDTQGEQPGLRSTRLARYGSESIRPEAVGGREAEIVQSSSSGSC
ncbi:hypothetical protein SUGI_1227110 [Cryptomeria japonica]|uniref:Uncharacterized protein n=1 Tax=Cryptomeria japonica TaxID=3369 RepID=A0AAD3NPV3_CRYJA|nr:hypothetical protein SUGI_1227110 [Cryptomeria japonica]